MYLFEVSRQVGEEARAELTALLGLTDRLQVGPRLLGPLLAGLAAAAVRPPRPGGARARQGHLAAAGTLTGSTRRGNSTQRVWAVAPRQPSDSH